ncbi:CinA family protein [Humibacter albus]|uniref:CinA family protein n=1 Tax=Humibacter albus TaxID=427754 RepID=UPI000527DB83|nr:CinA family protein [Humibacter albus]
MPRVGELDDECRAEAASIAALAQDGNLTITCAESLTSGAIASRLGAADSASEWFAGGIVAYSPRMKADVLGVEPGRVVTATCSEQMARGAIRLTGAHLAVAVTGEGGPEPAEDAPVGTVFIAVRSRYTREVRECHFDGGPAEVVAQTVLGALRMLRNAAAEQVARDGRG